MSKTPRPHIEYIIDTLQLINTHMPARQSAFMSDPNLQDATLMRLQDIGEQLSRIRGNFPEFYEHNQDNSWHQIIGLRNVISHGYHEVDFEIIWSILQNKIPDFSEQIQKIYKQL